MPGKIRVMELIAGFAVEGPSGGIAQFGINLINNLNPDQFERMICGLWNYQQKEEQERINQLNNDGIRAFAGANWVEEAPYRSFWKSYRTIASSIQQHPVDIIHSHSEFSDVIALLLKAQYRKVKIIRTVHNNRLWLRRRMRRLLLMNLLYPIMFQKEIGVSQDIVDGLDNRYIARRLGKKAYTIYNSINIDKFTKKNINPADVKKNLNIPLNAKVIGTIGRLTEQKGYQYLIKAVPLVVQNDPLAHFIIIGTGNLETQLQDHAKSLHIERHITFTGARKDIVELLSSMDLFVSSSLWEGLPTVLMESMAIGVPVLATDIPGTSEVIDNGVNGWLVPPASSIALAEGILHLLSLPNICQDISNEAKRKVQKFNIQYIAEQHKELYIDICKPISLQKIG
jgi:glycosyltransferase involved in cell wall biosynthesis